MTEHTCPDCMRGLPCERQPVESSLSRVVADAVNRLHPQRRSTDVGPSTCAAAQSGGCYCSGACYRREGLGGAFQPPVYFGHQRTDSEWKRDTFPQETM